MTIQNAECEGCHEVKPIPMIPIESGSPPLHGICAGCVERYRMQVGQRLRLRRPGRNGETEVTFASPTENAIWIRYSDGTTSKVGWSDFEKTG